MFHNLPEELLVEIGRQLPARSLLNMGAANSLFQRIRNDDSVWEKLAERDFGIFEKHKDEQRSWKEIYKFLYSHALEYLALITAAFNSPPDDSYKKSNFVGRNFLTSAAGRIMEIEEKLGACNSHYIYHYLIKKTKFFASISDLEVESFYGLHDESLKKLTLYTPIHVLAYLNKSEILSEIFQIDKRLTDILGYEYRTPLHVAAEEGCLEAAKTLIEFGANPLAGLNDEHGFTPFMSALRYGSPEVLSLLSINHPSIPDDDVDEFNQYAGFLAGWDDRPNEPIEFSDLYQAEVDYVMRRNVARAVFKDNTVLSKKENDMFLEYLDDPAHDLLPDAASREKECITWLYMNHSIDGKEFVNFSKLKETFTIDPIYCEVHNQLLSLKRKSQDIEQEQEPDENEENLPDNKRPRFG